MMHIAFCTDTNYVMPTGVAMISICENNREEEITFHLVITDEGTSLYEVEKKVQPLLGIARKYSKVVQTYSLRKEQLAMFECIGVSYVTTTAFARIFLPVLLPETISKVLYLDCDIACNGSLFELWNINLEENEPLAAVVDCNYAAPLCNIIAKVPDAYYYCNSGVLLMNLDSWRKNNYVELAIKVAVEQKFPMLDQDLLNHLFYDRMIYLPVKFNVQLVTLISGVDKCHVTSKYYNDLKDACNNPIIIHYLSPNKPWKTGVVCPFREVWLRYLDKSIWKNIEFEQGETKFDYTEIYEEFDRTYWMDTFLFIKSLSPFLRFFRASVKLKNKSFLVKLLTFLLNSSASFLEKVYQWKIRKNKV